MHAANSLNAVDPKNNATVAASAGSGKTWLLVTRIIRLLLEGTRPGGILALTFTRKAAAEMQLRLQQRLQEMATAKPTALDDLLASTGAEVNEANRSTARSLYEEVVHADFPVRLQTFHSFCQEILTVFPLEAEVPPGFELQEDTALLEQQARERLFADTTGDPDSELSAQFDILMRAANGPANTYSALDSMLDLRSDWWAFTEGQADACSYAVERMRSRLEIREDNDPYTGFFCSTALKQQLSQFAELLRKHTTATNTKHAAIIENVLASGAVEKKRFNLLIEVFLTTNQTPRARKASKTQAAAMGEQGQEHFLELHRTISDAMLECLEDLRRSNMLKINAAWYRCGSRYIEHFQEIKRNLRVLDFNDLEWTCYRLLKEENNAQWVQFKIDQRIDHVLVDEFQDTNPTQWQLILPILQEIGAGDPERARSIFLVGDEKQSIYQFRRANPALQQQASEWLHRRVDATETPLDASRRSSPVIMQAVNAVFSRAAISQLMPGFSEHTTYLDTPGEVRLLPLVPRAETGQGDTDDRPAGLRNPLLQPRPDDDHDHRNREAERLATVIEELVADGTPVIEGDEPAGQNADYGDILVLFRNRTNIAAYESALRRRGIPFLGSQRGSLLDNQEIEDIEKLLRCLITPFNNLDIAQILKSPVFDASDADLCRLAGSGNGPWYQRLQVHARDTTADHPLQRAARLLPHWQRLASVLPVHDLLDRIFAEGNLIRRYSASVCESQKQRVAANLQRFHEMSLEHNSGRYPGLSHFLHHLDNLRTHSRAKPDEPVQQTKSRVRLMTIHASKGLEAPVVILADADSKGSHANAWTALVTWPAEAERPDRFQLLLDSRSTDSLTADVLQQRLQTQAREELNLLYVAMTRARQYLLVSATQNTAAHSSGWYASIEQALGELAEAGEDGSITIRYGKPDTAKDRTTVQPPPLEVPAESLALLRRPLSGLDAVQHIRPSRDLRNPVDDSFNSPEVDEDGTLRGRVIHRALELMTGRTPSGMNSIRQIIRAEFLLPADTDVEDWLGEARSVISDDGLDEVFRPAGDALTRNEAPVAYRQDGRTVYGIIDRLVTHDEEVLVIDYKTHRVDSEAQISALLQRYSAQMDAYRTGIRMAWPNRQVRSALLFTRCRRLVYL